MSVNYGIFQHGKQTYVVSFYPPSGFKRIEGMHVRKLHPTEKNEIQCKRPANDEQEKYDKMRGSKRTSSDLETIKDLTENPDVPKNDRSSLRKGFEDLNRIFESNVPMGPFVARKLRLSEEPLANEALVNYVQRDFINAEKCAKNINELLVKYRGFDKQFKPNPEDICKN